MRSEIRMERISESTETATDTIQTIAPEFPDIFSEKVMIPIQATKTATINPITITLPFSTPYLNTIGKFADSTRICMHTGMRKSEKFKFCPRPTIRNAAPKTAEEIVQQMSPSKYFSPEISFALKPPATANFCQFSFSS